MRAICYELNAPKDEVRPWLRVCAAAAAALRGTPVLCQQQCRSPTSRRSLQHRHQAEVPFPVCLSRAHAASHLLLLAAEWRCALAAGCAVLIVAAPMQVVELILKNQSVLHGREMHLSVADIAHLAMLREPTGRIAE